MSDWESRVTTVERENESLRERIGALEAALGMLIKVPVTLGLGLSPTEGQMLGMLLARDFVSREAFHVALYQGRASAEDVPEIKIIDVLMCKIRAKLKPICGAKIETKWGEGYYIRATDKAVLRAAIAEKSA